MTCECQTRVACHLLAARTSRRLQLECRSDRELTQISLLYIFPSANPMPGQQLTRLRSSIHPSRPRRFPPSPTGEGETAGSFSYLGEPKPPFPYAVLLLLQRCVPSHQI